ncbi:hypothetical protein RM780_04890 [Streptomyces sp. DSM 44917]|uniref:Uncharacterized protein n=1 Tax=Streptomyces boetiae TaxID=3075541 RepID=A0ABU2L413_9ACTN|nr:hypothetical protein [Streptomyces sp. DSM 44917]MDT0306299.1 hypothetical protein [Streptomyces sp. DSM 44917]
MAGTREFKEVGEEPAALEAFLAGLARAFEKTLCLFEAQGTARSSPNSTPARVALGWLRPESIADGYPDASIPYATGELSYSLNDATGITFPCSADGDEPYPAPYTNASFSAGTEAWDPDLRMSVLNAAARVVADGLGCLEESGLPEGAPERVAGG